MAKRKKKSIWTPEAKAKALATRAANKAAKSSPAAVSAMTAKVSDATVYLQHAVKDIVERMQSGKLKRPDKAHMMAMLALSTLTE